MANFKGKLVSTGAAVDWTLYRVFLAHQRLDPDPSGDAAATPVTVDLESVATTKSDGLFEFALPELARLGPKGRLRVTAPSGEVVAEAQNADMQVFARRGMSELVDVRVAPPARPRTPTSPATRSPANGSCSRGACSASTGTVSRTNNC